MDSRQQFEEWAKKEGIFNLSRNLDGDYTFNSAHMAWEGWQASRESLVINNFSTYKFEGCKYYDAESVDDALTDAGITRK